MSDDLPIACTLRPDELEARRKGLLEDLVRQSSGCEVLDDGVRLRFAPSRETLSKITEAVEAERRCCRFLCFTLTVEPDEGPFTLALTGPRGTREFLTSLLEM